jgi:hypothetical protein
VFNVLIRPWIRARSTAEVLALAAEGRIPVAPVNSGATLPEQEQFRSRGVIGPMPGGAFVHPLPPYRIDGARPPVTRPAPPLGGGVSPLPPRPPLPSALSVAPPPFSAPFTSSTPSAAVPSTLPLAGLRVLDATSMWAGPVVGQLFAALGTDVIHLESVQRLDLSRLKGQAPGLVGARPHLVHGQLQQARSDPRPQPPGRLRAARAAAAELRRHLPDDEIERLRADGVIGTELLGSKPPLRPVKI